MFKEMGFKTNSLMFPKGIDNLMTNYKRIEGKRIK